MAVVAAKQDALSARIAGLALPDGGGWLGVARAEALTRLAAIGLPGRRDEHWRFTDSAPLNAPEAASAALDHRAGAEAFSGIDGLRLVFVDGVFDAANSDDPKLAGVEIELLGRAGTADIHWAQGLYGALEAQGQMPVARPFAALNSAFASDGALVRVTSRVDRTLSLIYRRKSKASDVILHHCIKIEAGAALTLLESGPAAARFNSVLEVEVGDGAQFHHVRAQGRDPERLAVTHVFARLGAAARFKSFTLAANGLLTRNEVVVDLAGDDAVAHVAGAAMGDGSFHHDDTVFITHAAERCESRQVFKKVLKNGAVGVFQGKILVRPGAQKTDGYQISQALLLDGDSQFLAKPELEIHADDVKCSHGSTVGAIDENTLFYLRSRGVPLKAAQALLVLAFLAEAMAEIDDPAIAETIRQRLESWLAEHDGAGAR
ncbi:MAG: Fe-S cluster assembly protein SufD [Pseudorhodobacter sp.]|nr:Fe-S cluster assembly protein SufD [Pseudorhodobacter sp.]